MVEINNKYNVSKFGVWVWEFWNRWYMQIFFDGYRILLIIMMILIFRTLIIEIDTIKILQYDPCKICMVKTGAMCLYNEGRFNFSNFSQIYEEVRKEVYESQPKLNLSSVIIKNENDESI